MNDREQDNLTREEFRRSQAAPRRSGGFGRALRVLLTLLIVLAVVVAAAWKDLKSLDSVKRLFSYNKITQDEQKRIVKIREQVQNTINDLRIKKVIDGDDSIVASLNAIEDNMGTLGVNYDDPKIESIVQPDEKATRENLFKKIMAE